MLAVNLLYLPAEPDDGGEDAEHPEGADDERTQHASSPAPASMTDARLDEDWLRTLVARAVKRPELAERLIDNFVRYEMQARGDDVRMEAFRRQLPGRPAIAVVPNFEEDLHDLDGLRRMLPHLLAA